MKFVKRVLLLGLLLVVLAAAYGAYALFINPSLTVTAEKQTYWRLWQNPEQLTQLGAIEGSLWDFHSGDLNDASWEKRLKDQKAAEDNLAAIRAYDSAKLQGQEKLTYAVLSWSLSETVNYKPIAWLGPGDVPYPVNQMFGMQNQLPRFMQFSHVVINGTTARNYVARLTKFGVKFDQMIDVVQRQAKMGVVPPSFVIDKVIAEGEGFVATPTRENPLYTTYAEKLAKLDISDDEKASYAADAEAAINDVVYPAFNRLVAALKEIRPRATPDAGVWKQPNGDAYYALALKDNTTTDLTPQQVHEIGLAEVARITAEMDAILRAEGLTEGSVGERMIALGADPRFQFEDSDAGRAAIIAEYTRLIAEINARMGEVFAVVPTQPVEVVRVPAFAEAGSAGAYYNRPSLDGTRPGRFFANLRFVNETPKWSMKTLAYHEAIPGHHHQASTSLSLDLPLARTELGFTAYSEGWALYAERLAWEIGMYKDDPYGDLGRLQGEIFRAVRLVVDTGMHFKRWSREQAIDYMVANTGMAATDVTAEIERYAVMPGQACAYKIGMIKILELREKAKAELGDRFDLKGFHSAVLENGPLPLTVLEQVVDAWIAGRKG